MNDKQDEALEALERLHHLATTATEVPRYKRMMDADEQTIRAALERQRVPDECGWCSGPGPLNAEGLCAKCLYPDGPPKGWKLVPVVPTIDMLLAIKGHGKFPEDWEAGKALQREHGLKVVPPECNIETAAGQYVKLLAAAPEPDGH